MITPLVLRRSDKAELSGGRVAVICAGEGESSLRLFAEEAKALGARVDLMLWSATARHNATEIRATERGGARHRNVNFLSLVRYLRRQAPLAIYTGAPWVVAAVRFMTRSHTKVIVILNRGARCGLVGRSVDRAILRFANVVATTSRMRTDEFRSHYPEYAWKVRTIPDFAAARAARAPQILVQSYLKLAADRAPLSRVSAQALRYAISL